jgi:hypothetical protein
MQAFEAIANAERNPSSVADFVRATFSHKGRRTSWGSSEF